MKVLRNTKTNHKGTVNGDELIIVKNKEKSEIKKKQDIEKLL